MGLFDRFRRPGKRAEAEQNGSRAPVPDGESVLALARRGASVDDQRERLSRALAGSGLSQSGVQATLALVRDGIALLEDDGAEGTTRLGGEALLPPGESWPLDSEGRPLTFMAIDFDELPALDPLPGSGTLLVFWNELFFELERLDFVAASRVYFVDAGEPVPAEPPLAANRFGPIRLKGAAMPVLGELERLEVSEEDHDAVLDVDDVLFDERFHHLLGSSRDIQGPVLDEVAGWLRDAYSKTRERYSSSELQGKGWTLLAQFEEPPGAEFGDAGAVYLVIPDEDLRLHRFDRVMGIMQCH